MRAPRRIVPPLTAALLTVVPSVVLSVVPAAGLVEPAGSDAAAPVRAVAAGCPRTDLLDAAPVTSAHPAAGVVVRAYNGTDGHGHAARLTVAQADVGRVRLTATSGRYGEASRTTDLAAAVPAAAAAVNGDYFAYDWSGDAVPAGPLVLGGRVLRLPSGGRLAVGSDPSGRPFAALVRVTGQARLPGRVLPVGSVNDDADPDRPDVVAAGRAVAVVTPWLGAARPARQREVVVRHGAVVASGRRLPFGDALAYGSGAVGRGDLLLAADGAAGRALAGLRRGDAVAVTYGARADGGVRPVQAVGSGAFMLHAGRVLASCTGLGSRSRPRTVVAWSADRSRVWLLTVDGRGGTAPVSRYGAGYRQIAEVARALGAAEAVMLDGGGSTTMALRGADGRVRRVDAPERTPQRPVPDALLLVPRPPSP